MRIAFWRHQHKWFVIWRVGNDDHYTEKRECVCGETDLISVDSFPLFAPAPRTQEDSRP